MLVRGSRHKCCGPPAPCVELDDFSGYFWTAWDEVDDPSGSTPLTLDWDRDNERMGIEGQGSVTHRVTSNPSVIHVAAEIQSLVSGSAGVTIRRVDSSDNISLWWMGGTSYELRQGSTVLESIVGSGSGKIKVELATPRDPTTDILVYIDDTLVHTEVGVAFVMPDVLHLGMVIDGDAVFEWVEVSPCPASECEPVSGSCFGVGRFGEPDFVPRVYHVSIPWPSDHGSNSWPDPYDCTDVSFDVLYNQDLYFRLNDSLNIVLFDEISGQWVDYSLSECAYAPVVPGRVAYEFSNPFFPVANPSRVMPIPSGKLAMMKAGFCYAGTMINPQPVAIYPHSSSYSTGDNPDDNGWQLTGDSQNVGTELAPVWQYRYRVTWGPSGAVSYASGWFDFGDDTPTRESTTLSLITNDSIYSGWEPTVTLEPNGGSKEVVRSLIGCGDETCEPPVTPQPGMCYVQTINLVDADDNPWYMTAVLGVQFDDTTGSWYWEGTASPHPLADPHPTCGEIIFATIKIYCVELEEGASKSWVLDLTYDGQTSRFPMVEDPEFGYGWEGTTDKICSGQTWDFFAGPLNSSDSTWQFGSCEWDACSDPHGYYFGAGLITECDGGSGYTQNGGLLIFSPTSPRPWMTSPSGSVYYSPVPSGYSGQVAGIYIYVESGTVRVQLVDGQLDPIPDGFASVGYSCDLNDGRPVISDTSPISYLWGFPSPVTSDPFGMCEGTTGFGSWEVVFP